MNPKFWHKTSSYQDIYRIFSNLLDNTKHFKKLHTTADYVLLAGWYDYWLVYMENICTLKFEIKP